MVGKTIKRAVMGFILGMAIGNIITLIIGFLNTGNTVFFSHELIDTTGSVLGAMTAQTLLSGLFGAICFGCISFHEVEWLWLLPACLLHYGSIMASYFPIALFLHWFNLVPLSIGIMIAIMTAAYFIVWIIMFLKYKADVRELNELLAEAY